jgi:Uma2 family endonuclease
MSVETKLMTADELLRMPDDGMRHELVEGELITMSPAGSRHGIIAARIARHLGNYVEKHNLGEVFAAETGFVLRRGPDTVRAPDVGFVQNERLVDTPKYFPGAPDFAVEVLSPDDRASEVEAKVRMWLKFGARAVVVVDPEKQTATVNIAGMVTRLTIDDSIDGGEVVPGWTLPLRDLFK